jgi:hypothetical protein
MNFWKTAVLFPLILIAPIAAADHDHRRVPGPSQHEWARYYADTTLRQVHQNRWQHCNYHGQRWSPRYNEHFEWALHVSRGKARSEINRRERDLTHCLARKRSRHNHGAWHYWRDYRHGWRSHGEHGYRHYPRQHDHGARRHHDNRRDH